jgi:hypothetical protein
VEESRHCIPDHAASGSSLYAFLAPDYPMTRDHGDHPILLPTPSFFNLCCKQSIYSIRPLRGPWETLGWPLRDAWVTQG